MSEKEKDLFYKRATAIGVGLAITGTAGIAIGQNLNNEGHNADAAEAATEKTTNQEALRGSIEAAINAEYDAKDIIGEIVVEQGTTLGSEAEAIVKNTLGDELYDNVKESIYDPLLYSAKLHNPQPGETYPVVEVDLDPENNNGNEYIVVNETKN